MDNTIKILVMFASNWQMDNGNTGMTLNYYLFGENGELMQPVNNLSGGTVGQQRAKCSMATAMRQKISFVPGVYNAQVSYKVGSDGKPVLTVTDLDFVAKADIRMQAPGK